MKRPDGWYWFIDTDLGRPMMYRLWTGTTGTQQLYLRGRTRERPRMRAALLARGTWVEAVPPDHVRHDDSAW